MLVERHHKFDAQFPEEFPWHAVSQKSISEVAPLIVQAIHADLRSRHRLDTPGLRKALIIMAGAATLMD